MGWLCALCGTLCSGAGVIGGALAAGWWQERRGAGDVDTSSVYSVTYQAVALTSDRVVPSARSRALPDAPSRKTGSTAPCLRIFFRLALGRCNALAPHG